jgi:predicted nucleotidyltransferase
MAGFPCGVSGRSDFLKAMRDAARQTHQAERTFHHYVHMARRNYRGTCWRNGTPEKYLYVLRLPVHCRAVEQGRGVAPMPFQELVDAIVTDSDLLGAIDQLLAIKRAVGEGEHGSPFPIINAFIDAELSRLETVLPPVLRDTDYSILDRLLMDTVLAGDKK